MALLLFFLVNFAAASSGAIFRPGEWYRELPKPSWTPPNWVFPVVWTILFTMNAVAGWLVWRAGGADAAGPLALYAVSLVFNAGWSALFFGLKRVDLALADVAALWLSLALLIAFFAPWSALAAGLLAPYLLWVTLAAALNFRILQMRGRAEAGA